MRYLTFLIVCILASCETSSFESDKRQLVAKDLVRKKLRGATSFDITGFKQDTLQTFSDTNYRRLLRYHLDIVYTDSLQQVQKKNGIVLFTPDGKSVINVQIED
jgi:hypothetical protein